MSSKAEVRARYARLLSALTSSVFHDAGFRRRGTTWHLDAGECWQVVQFQVSRDRSDDSLTFTISVSVASKRLMRFEGRDPGQPPQEPTCHVRHRLGTLIPEVRDDRWWRVDATTDMDALRREITAGLVWHAFPWLRTTGTDASLRSLFESGRGTTRVLALRYARHSPGSNDRACRAAANVAVNAPRRMVRSG